MRHYHSERSQSFHATVNPDKPQTLVSEQTWVNAAKNRTRAAPVTDMARPAVTEFWGKELPKQPAIAKASFFSRRAEEKIRGV